jgi:hypothetical protein
MPSMPQTDGEWAIHSINIHGIFFERWCQRVVSQSPGWTLNSANYPVEFPPPNGPIRGKESTLDIRASRQVDNDKISLLIECKKNNPNFVDWVFFQKPIFRPNRGFIVSQVKNEPRASPALGWDTSSSLRHLATTYSVTDEARETRGSYGSLKAGEKTKTSNASIQDAAYQIALAKQAIVGEDDNISRRLGSPNSIFQRSSQPRVCTCAHSTPMMWTRLQVRFRSRRLRFRSGRRWSSSTLCLVTYISILSISDRLTARDWKICSLGCTYSSCRVSTSQSFFVRSMDRSPTKRRWPQLQGPPPRRTPNQGLQPSATDSASNPRSRKGWPLGRASVALAPCM